MSFYTPYRFATLPVRSRYTALPYPWWNRYTIRGTTT